MTEEELAKELKSLRHRLSLLWAEINDAGWRCGGAAQRARAGERYRQTLAKAAPEVRAEFERQEAEAKARALHCKLEELDTQRTEAWAEALRGLTALEAQLDERRKKILATAEPEVLDALDRLESEEP